jgi:hypothetical protein
LSEAACITKLDRERWVAASSGGGCLFHVKRQRIDEMNRVALVGEPGRVDAGTTADVEHGGRRARKEALQQLLGPGEFDPR